ncbi:MAG TPA: hypothetical protein VK714_02100 [Myxococcota bacterium]|nr:hypothetical protein [Myxococcota bacterium]
MDLIDSIGQLLANVLIDYCDDHDMTTQELDFVLIAAKKKLGGCHDPDDPRWRVPYREGQPIVEDSA